MADTGVTDAPYDVLVVGGGPVGSYVAWKSAEAGLRAGVLEEHDVIGEPVMCGGLVAPRCMEFLPKAMAEEVTLAEIRGARIFPPLGENFEFTAPEPRGVVISRGEFDRKFALCAQRAGAEMRLGEKFWDGSRENGHVVIETDDGRKLRARVLVGADGVSSRVARVFGLGRPKEIIPQAGFYTPNDGIRTDRVDVLVGTRRAPGFFAWMIPGPCDLNVGLGVRRGHRAKRYLDALAEEMGAEWRIGERRLYTSGIPVGFAEVTAMGNIALVGDAAAQAKPTSGGGIYTGLHCADILQRTIVEQSGNGEIALQSYDYLWKESIGPELKRGMWLRKVFLKLDDKALEAACKVLRDPRVLRVIEEHGDIDFPSKLVSPLLRHAPSLARFAGPLLKSLV
jgi:geranylgeranyl reductase family protein